MNRAERGFLLTETLLHLSLIVLILWLSVGPLRLFVRELHQTHQDYQTQCTVRNMLETLRRDIQQSCRMSVFESDNRTGGNLLCLRNDQDLVLYQLTDGIVTRMSMPPRPGRDQQWILPKLRIDWKSWDDAAGRSQAVEIYTCIERKVLGKNRSFLKTAEVMFADLDPVGGQP